MHAPAAGRIVADAVLSGRLDPEFAALGMERFAHGEVPAEVDVI